MANNNTQTGNETMTNATYKVKGVVSAERACECCGNNRLERNVVLTGSDGSLLYVGSDCAGKLVYGAKKASNTKQVLKEAEFITKCRDLLDTNPASEVKEYVNRMTCNGQVYLDRLYALGLA